MVGRVGVALTALRPAGRAEFGETLLDVVTEGGFVPKGERVKVLEVRGNRVVVAPAGEE
jgi:membrane-bound serine protease (ClpP class)